MNRKRIIASLAAAIIAGSASSPVTIAPRRASSDASSPSPDVQQGLPDNRPNKLEEELPLQCIGDLAKAARSPAGVGIDQLLSRLRAARHPTLAHMSVRRSTTTQSRWRAPSDASANVWLAELAAMSPRPESEPDSLIRNNLSSKRGDRTAHAERKVVLTAGRYYFAANRRRSLASNRRSRLVPSNRINGRR